MPSSTRTPRSAAREVSQQTRTGAPGAAVAPPVSVTTSAPRAARTAAAPPVPQPDLASTTLVPSTTRFEDLPCVTQGSLGAGNVCEASRVWTADRAACDAGPQTELVYRLTPQVTTLQPVPGMLGFLEVLCQAEATRNATINSSAFRNKLALSGIAEYAVGVILASGLLRQSNG